MSGPWSLVRSIVAERSCPDVVSPSTTVETTFHAAWYPNANQSDPLRMTIQARRTPLKPVSRSPLTLAPSFPRCVRAQSVPVAIAAIHLPAPCANCWSA